MGALLIRRQLTIDKAGSLGAKNTRWIGFHRGRKAGAVVCAAGWWCLRWLRSLCAWADSRKGLGERRDVDTRGGLCCQID